MARRPTAKRIAAINGARLDDVAGIRVLREAAPSPDLWRYVAPTVLEALLPLTAKAAVLGLTLDDVLAEIEDYQVHAARSRAPVMSALAFVESEIDLRLEWHHDATVAQATRSTSTEAARTARTKLANARVESWIAEIEARPDGWLVKEVQADIAAREGKTLADVQGRIADYRKRQRQKSI